MRKPLLLLVIMLFPVALLQAQYKYTRPVRETLYICRNNGSVSVGVTGSFSANDMVYTSVMQSKLQPVLGPTFGLAMEWNTMKLFSVGMDLSFAHRGTHESYSSEFLTSYTATAHAQVDYSMLLNAIELRVPIICYVGFGDFFRPYLFVAPRLDYWLWGDLKWVRSYEDGTYAPLEYETKVTNATIAPFDVSAVAGLGVCARLVWGRMRYYVKGEVSYGVSVMSNFSPKEVNAEHQAEQGTVVDSPVVLGWGDLVHEDLGRRYLQNVEARLTLLVPLRRHLKDACALKQDF